jgi:hypothetical protein
LVHIGQHGVLTLRAGKGKEHEGMIVDCSVLSRMGLGITMMTSRYYRETYVETFSLKLPKSLGKRLQQAAKKRGQSKSEIARAALEQFLSNDADAAPGSLLQAMQPWIGCVAGPGDLSTNPKHMEGFGK